MTTGEKAKAYDEALKKIQPLYEQPKKDGNPIWSTYEYLFPELAESEDERIRRWLVDYFRSVGKSWIHRDISPEQIIAYLEKQKEPLTPEEKMNHRLYLEGFDVGKKVGETLKEQKPITESKRLANEVIEYLTRCGYSPVLKDDSKKEHFHIDIPRHKDDFWHSEEYKHCRSVLGEYYMEGDYGGDTYTLYIWRAKKEQKPAEWSEEDENMRDTIIRDLKRLGGDIVNVNPAYKPEIDWLKSLPERFNLSPKQEWSEEDEAFLKVAIAICNRYSHKDIADWLKSLRPQPHCNTYYDIIHNILDSLKGIDFTQITPEHRVSLLNDIRVKCKNADECAAILDEPHWKPSEEQIRAIVEALKYLPNNKDEWIILDTLVDVLRKLM